MSNDGELHGMIFSDFPDSYSRERGGSCDHKGPCKCRNGPPPGYAFLPTPAHLKSHDGARLSFTEQQMNTDAIFSDKNDAAGYPLDKLAIEETYKKYDPKDKNKIEPYDHPLSSLDFQRLRYFLAELENQGAYRPHIWLINDELAVSFRLDEKAEEVFDCVLRNKDMLNPVDTAREMVKLVRVSGAKIQK